MPERINVQKENLIKVEEKNHPVIKEESKPINGNDSKLLNLKVLPLLAQPTRHKQDTVNQSVVYIKGKLVTPSSFVGFANLPKQIYRKSLKKGFEFSLMVVGESGLGKTTLINSLFLTDIYTNKEDVSIKVKRTVEVNSHRVKLEEGGVRLSLNIIDTPGNLYNKCLKRTKQAGAELGQAQP